MRNYGPVRLVRQHGGGGFRGFGDASLTAANLLAMYNPTKPGHEVTQDALNYWQSVIDSQGWDAAVLMLKAALGSDALTPTTTPPVVVVTPPVVTGGSGGGMLDGYITLPVVGTVSKKTAALVAAGIAAYFFLQD